MPSTLSVKSLLLMGFHTHTHTHTDTLYATHVSILSLHQKINNEEYLTENFFSLRNVPGVLKRQKKNLGGGGAKLFFSLLNFFFKKCSWGSETHANKNLFFGGGGGDFGVFGAPHAPTRGSGGVGKQYTSSYDHDM